MSSEETEAEAVGKKPPTGSVALLPIGCNKSDWSILKPTFFPGHFTNMRKREGLSKMDVK